jgi:hypothetical protein
MFLFARFNSKEKGGNARKGENRRRETKEESEGKEGNNFLDV